MVVSMTTQNFLTMIFGTKLVTVVVLRILHPLNNLMEIQIQMKMDYEAPTQLEIVVFVSDTLGIHDTWGQV